MLYYIHGYLSTPHSTKGTLFKEKLQAISIKYRDGKPEDLVITDCLQRIRESIRGDNNIVLIGSSLGGFLAAATALNNKNVKHLILLNPALIPPSTDRKTITDLPQSIAQDMIEPRLFFTKLSCRITIFRGIDDDVVPDEWVLSFARAQEATVHFIKDDHRFSQSVEHIAEKISQLLM